MAQGEVQVDRRRALTAFTLVAALIVLIDQITKHLAVVRLEDEESTRLLGGVVYLTLVRNSGMAFSLNADYTFALTIVAMIVSVGLILLARTVRSLLWAVPLGLVLGGALGNLGDRLFRAPSPFKGHVVDMISVFGDRGEAFPVFNIADSALCVGVVVIVLLEMTGRRRDGSRAPAEGAAAPAERPGQVAGPN